MSKIDSTIHAMERNLLFLKLSKFFYAVLFVQPILILYYGTKGLSTSDFFKLQLVSVIAMFLVEIPGGYLCDRWKRRSVLLLSTFFILSANIWMYAAQTMLELSFVFLLGGIGLTLYRVSSGAILYDTLQNLKQEKTHTKIYGSMISLSHITIGLSALLSGFLFSLHVDAPVLIQGIFRVALIFVSLSLVEPERDLMKSKGIHLDVLWQTLKYVLFKHKDLKWVILLGAMLGVSSMKAYWVIQPVMKSLDLSVIFIGFAGALSSILIAYTTRSAHKWAEKIAVKKLLIISAIFSFSSFFLSGLNLGTFGFLILFLSFISFGTSHVLVQTMVNERASSDIRATTLAISSSTINLLFAVITFIVACALELVSMNIALLIVAGIIALVCIPALIFIKAENKP